MSPISKLSYLTEFLLLQLRTLIDGLPFISESYARANLILSSKFGKPSEFAVVVSVFSFLISYPEFKTDSNS